MAYDRRKPYKNPSPRKRRSRRKPRHGENKRGLNSKIHLAVDAHDMLVRVLVTSVTVADCTQACRLVEGLDADYLIAGKGCDSDAIVRMSAERGMTVVIPPRSNRKSQREYDKYLHRARHLVENAFLNKIVGAAQLHDMRNILRHFQPLYKSVASPSGQKFQLNRLSPLSKFHLPAPERPRSAFPGNQALLKALYLATVETVNKWRLPIRDWSRIYGEMSIMYEGRLPD